MKTKPKNGFPAIDWEITDELLSSDVDEREETYVAIGFDNQGHKYSGTALYSCGELLDILDVETDWPAEHSPEAYFGDVDSLGRNYSDADPGL